MPFLKKELFFKLLEESYPGIKANIAHCETLGFSWSSIPFLKEDKGEILSHVGFLEYPLLIEGRQFKVGALHAICTKMANRGQGLASELIREALKWAKERYDFVILFTEIPHFYEKFSFRYVQEHLFHLRCKYPKGKHSLKKMVFPEDNLLFLRSFHDRVAVSNQLWVMDDGTITSFNALFATYPIYWSLHYSPLIDGIISYQIKDKTLHLFDIIANKIPSLDLILDHLPTAIDKITFYFPPEKLTRSAFAEPYLYHDSGYFMVHGHWPLVNPFVISPLNRC